jgi:hypothetical protein
MAARSAAAMKLIKQLVSPRQPAIALRLDHLHIVQAMSPPFPANLFAPRHLRCRTIHVRLTINTCVTMVIQLSVTKSPSIPKNIVFAAKVSSPATPIHAHVSRARQGSLSRWLNMLRRLRPLLLPRRRILKAPMSWQPHPQPLLPKQGAARLLLL